MVVFDLWDQMLYSRKQLWAFHIKYNLVLFKDKYEIWIGPVLTVFNSESDR